MEQIAPQIYRWTAPHPEWRSSVEEVVSYALVDGEALALVDPLLPSQDDARRAPLHAGVKKRLTRLAPLEVIPQSATGEAAEIADGAVLAYTIGKPRRSEYPLYFPGLRAFVFGDAVVGAQGGLRFWNQSSGTGAAWYRDVFAPTLRPLAERDIEYVLVTHGPAVLENGQRALEECLAAAPVDPY